MIEWFKEVIQDLNPNDLFKKNQIFEDYLFLKRQ